MTARHGDGAIGTQGVNVRVTKGMNMLSWLQTFVKRLFKRKTFSLVIVRRYADANKNFVGELYLLGSFAGVLGYQMIGCSLDTLPFDAKDITAFDLDTIQDFLQPMPVGCVRVGAISPRDNDNVRRHIARLAKTGTFTLRVQNRFIEQVLERKEAK